MQQKMSVVLRCGENSNGYMYVEPYSPWKDGLWSWLRKWFSPGLGVLPKTTGFRRGLWSKHTWKRIIWQRPESEIYAQVLTSHLPHVCVSCQDTLACIVCWGWTFSGSHFRVGVAEYSQKKAPFLGAVHEMAQLDPRQGRLTNRCMNLRCEKINR